MKDFKIFLGQLIPTNAKLDYFIDLEKVENNVRKVEMKLNQLNYLIGKDDLKTAIDELFNENPNVFQVLDILIAVREGEKTSVICDEKGFRNLKSYFNNPTDIYFYIRETGLEEVLKDKKIKNLVDYVFGIEVGLDSNARKNRGGKNMSSIIENTLIEEGISYKKEVVSTNFIDLKTLGVDKKVFDYVIEKNGIHYLIEVNFYSGGGSKLNETARAYGDLSKKLKDIQGIEFVWITDGIGWLSAKNKLEEAYNTIDRVYNLTTLNEFIQELKK